MLFDLRSRGRRRTVQGVYLLLALILGGGLVLFGVGNGNGIGGLLNGLSSSNSGQQTAAVSQSEKTAERQTQQHPTDPSAWASLVRAHYSSAEQNRDATTGVYTPAGKKVLAQTTQAWERYLRLVKKPDSDLAVLAARAYDGTGNFKQEASTWEIVTAANPDVSTFYQNLALAAWEAGETNLGDLASAKAVAVSPKAARFELKHTLSQLRTQALAASGASTGTTTPGATTTTPATTTTTPATTTTTPAAGKTKQPATSSKKKSKTKAHH